MELYHFSDRIGIESLLRAAGFKERGGRWQGVCPHHAGADNPTAVSFEYKNGKWLVHCFTGKCPSSAIWAALGVGWKGERDSSCPVEGCKSDSSTLQAIYEGLDGRRRGVHRLECEEGRTCSYTGCDESASKHVWHCPKGNMPQACFVKLWGDDDEEKTLVVVEGEKAARHLQVVAGDAYTAVSWPGGTNAIRHQDFGALAGRRVILWPDNDDAGRKAMDELGVKLAGKRGAVKDWKPNELLTVAHEDLQELPAKADAADCDREDIVRLLLGSELYLTAGQRAYSDEGREAAEDFSGSALAEDAFARRFLASAPNQLGVALNPLDEYKGTLYVVGKRNGVWRQDDGWARILYLRSIAEFEEDAEAALKHQNFHAFDAVQSKCMEMRKNKQYNAVMAWIHAVVRDDRSHIPNILVLEDINEMNADMRYMGALNGVVDIETGQLLRGREAALKYVSRQIPVSYKPGATHPDVDAWTSHWSAKERDAFWASIAYALLEAEEAFVHIWIGKGGEGKSTNANILKGAFGEYVSISHPDALAHRRGGGTGLSPEMKAFVDGIRIAFVMESQIRKSNISWEKVKSISGKDIQPWRDLYKSIRESKATATIFMPRNDLPAPDMSDHAIVRRLRPLRIPQLREVDHRFLHKMRSVEVRQAIVAKVVQEAGRYIDGPPAIIPSVQNELARIEQETNPELEWIDAALTYTKQHADKVLLVEIYEAAQRTMDTTDKPFGLEQAELVSRARNRLELPSHIRSKTLSVKGRPAKGWREVILHSDEEIIAALEKGEQELPAPESTDTPPVSKPEPLPPEPPRMIKCKECGLESTSSKFLESLSGRCMDCMIWRKTMQVRSWACANCQTSLPETAFDPGEYVCVECTHAGASASA